MRTLLKIVLIFIAFMITTVIIFILKGGSDGFGGPIGIIVLFAFMAGARAIWKYEPSNNTQNQSNPNDHHKFDKS